MAKQERRLTRTFFFAFLTCIVFCSWAQSAENSKKHAVKSRVIEITSKIASNTITSFLFNSNIEKVILKNIDPDRYRIEVKNDRDIYLLLGSVPLGERNTLVVILKSGTLINIQLKAVPKGIHNWEHVFGERTSPSKTEHERNLKYRGIAATKNSKALWLEQLMYGSGSRPIHQNVEIEEIKLHINDAIALSKQETVMRFYIENNSPKPFTMANLQIVHQRDGGFLLLKRVEEKVLESDFRCDQDHLEILPKQKVRCAVHFIRDQAKKRWFIGLKVLEASSNPRNLAIHRIKELNRL